MNYFLGIQGGKLATDYEEGTGQASPGANHQLIGATTVTTNAWHHAAATFDGSTVNLYLDGNLDGTLAVGTGKLPQSNSTQHASIGSAQNSSGAAAGFFSGVIDEARIWNVARTQAEIQGAKNTEIASTGGLIGLWHLNDGSGTTALNSGTAGTAVNGTLTNTTGGSLPRWVTGFDVTNAAVQMNGTSQHVTFGAAPALGASAFTLELWFKRTGAGTPTGTGTGGLTNAIPLITKGRGEAETPANLNMNYFFGIDSVTGTSSPTSRTRPVVGTIPWRVWRRSRATYGTTPRSRWRSSRGGARRSGTEAAASLRGAAPPRAARGAAIRRAVRAIPSTPRLPGVMLEVQVIQPGPRRTRARCARPLRPSCP